MQNNIVKHGKLLEKPFSFSFPTRAWDLQQWRRFETLESKEQGKKRCLEPRLQRRPSEPHLQPWPSGPHRQPRLLGLLHPRRHWWRRRQLRRSELLLLLRRSGLHRRRRSERRRRRLLSPSNPHLLLSRIPSLSSNQTLVLGFRTYRLHLSPMLRLPPKWPPSLLSPFLCQIAMFRSSKTLKILRIWEP